MNRNQPLSNETIQWILFPILILLLAVLIFLAFTGRECVNHEPAAAGVLDLRDWDFAEHGPVKLEGEWGFRWGELADPGIAEYGASDSFIKVPGYWNKYPLGGSAAGPLGFATYSLRVLLPPTDETMTLRIRDVQTAYALYLDGRRIAGAGIVGTSAKTVKADYQPVLVSFPVEGNELNLMMHVSNFHHRNGGMWDTIEFGPEQQVLNRYERSISTDLFLVGFIVAMGFYHFLRFSLRRQDNTSLYFGLFCFLIAFRSLTVGNLHAYRTFPDLSWQIILKVEYISFYLATPVFLSYLREIFPNEFNRIVLRTVQIFSALLILFVLAAPPLIFEKSLNVFQVATIISGIYALYILVLSGIHGRESAGLLLRGFLFLFIFVINDILYTNQIINTGHLLPWGQLIFLLSQAYLIARLSAQTFKKLKTTNDMLAESRLGIILGLAKLAEYRDEDTGIHLERIREYSRIIAEFLSHLPEYQGYVTKEYIDDIYHSSILHDIGKVGIPDAILLKPDRLTPEEFEIIKRHSRLGGDAIHNVETGMNARSFLTLGKQVAYSHHEKWSGKGYPDGTRGKDIPLSARIVSLADVYDALTSIRPYKDAFSHKKTREMILSERGLHFDPDVVDAFMANEAEFERIRREMDERESPPPAKAD